MAVGDKMDGSGPVCEWVMPELKRIFSWSHDGCELFGKYLFDESADVVILREVGSVRIWRVSRELLTEESWSHGID